jgi:hypothetical protein
MMNKAITETLDRKIAEAMLMAGLSARLVEAARAGATVYGDDGMIDSLGLVRLIGAMSGSLEEHGVDMFDMLQALDVQAVDAFASFASIRAFLDQVLTTSTEAV